MRNLYSLLFLCLTSWIYCQLDTEHWFAPMYMTSSNGKDEIRLYLSTNEANPFYVKIENNNQILDSVQIQKGQPKAVVLPFNKMVSTEESTSPSTLGLHVFGEKKFFANLRFSQVNHAEIITSKGRAGLGQHFFVAYAPFAT
ncbi:hypothetical protein [Bergeyella sp. RCAD1439]|uniref:hypothetical protein n=1 Tax=Bergeyella anatis TaxID=3113737 RepID=UPI002E17ED9F|nr:hypothetical protein [Bergeyella sp. RCAD1439]